MSRSRSKRRESATAPAGRRLLQVAMLLAVAAAPGCWEQIDDGKWFPQMKRQLAVQAFEDITYLDQVTGFSPPEGTVVAGEGDVPDLLSMTPAEQDALTNPVPRTLDSMNRGKELFGRYCAACHGPEGLGDGPVAGPPFGTGPLGLVLPIGGPQSIARVYSDGHIYATMTLGRGRMPSYQRITHEDRWNVIHYIRELNGQGGAQ